MKELLMIPGPVEIPQAILEEFNGQSPAHYGDEWTKLYLNLIGDITNIFNGDGKSYLIPGSGSFGLETAISTYVSNKKCIILGNGFFGERLKAIATNYASELDYVKNDTKRPVDPGKFIEYLKKEKTQVVIMTQVETSTGILNPVKEIGKIARENNIFFILDAISGAITEELDMEEFGVDVVVSASQKGFSCPPGLAMVTVNKKALEEIKYSENKSWCINLKVWEEYYHNWFSWHPFPVTLPTNTIKALNKSVEIIKSSGIGEINQKYRRFSDKLREALEFLSLELYIPKEFSAHGLSAVSSSGRFNCKDLKDFLYENCRIKVASSLGEIGEKIFRIGHMSDAQIDPENVKLLLKGISDFLIERKIDHDLDSALKIF